jgi:tetratricopeptide (TPR) repeat protein
MNEGDELLGKSRNEEAKGKYSQAAELAPDLMELPFWQAVTLADTGKLDQALPLFQKIFRQNPDWAELVMRLPAAGLMKDDPETLEKIRSLI